MCNTSTTFILPFCSELKSIQKQNNTHIRLLSTVQPKNELQTWCFAFDQDWNHTMMMTVSANIKITLKGGCHFALFQSDWNNSFSKCMVNGRKGNNMPSMIFCYCFSCLLLIHITIQNMQIRFLLHPHIHRTVIRRLVHPSAHPSSHIVSVCVMGLALSNHYFCREQVLS